MQMMDGTDEKETAHNLSRCLFFLVLSSRVQKVGTHLRPEPGGWVGGGGGRLRGSLSCWLEVAAGHRRHPCFCQAPAELGWAAQELPHQGGGVEPEVGVWALG